MQFKLIKKISAVAFAAVIAFCALVGCSTGGTPDLLPHLIDRAETLPERPIDSFETAELSAFSEDNMTDMQYRARVDELYATVVYDNKKPIFKENDPVKKVYDAAISVLDRYVLNAWHTEEDGQYNTVHALHDYLVCYIDYDFKLYDRYLKGETELGNDPAFFIDGALLGGKAVCDGLSRTFAFLCAVEGIECLRVTGSLSSSPHAWNKVKVGGKWYNIDITADAAHYNINGGKYYKQLSHGYFLLSDKTFAEYRSQPHSFGPQPYVAEEDFDYYSDRTVELGGETYSLTITSVTELNKLFYAIKQNRNTVGKIEVKLSYPGATQVNITDMYSADIEAALKSIGISYGYGALPYFGYPNGVFLLLLYR